MKTNKMVEKIHDYMLEKSKYGTFDTEPRDMLKFVIASAKKDTYVTKQFNRKLDWDKMDASWWCLFSDMKGTEKIAKELTIKAKELYNKVKRGYNGKSMD